MWTSRLYIKHIWHVAATRTMYLIIDACNVLHIDNITTIYRQYDLCSKLLHLVLLICSVYSAYLTLMPSTNECRRFDRVRPGSMPPDRTTPVPLFRAAHSLISISSWLAALAKMTVLKNRTKLIT
ncbi:hypothetical protein V1524DRAFT_427095 [Lipomyces starkeyi]